MEQNMVSVSWGDHLEFGEGDGALDTAVAIERSVARWNDELGASTILWREARSKQRFSRKYHTPGVSRRSISPRFDPEMDEHKILIDLAHRRGMKVFVYVTIFDEGWPLELCWRGGYESWQSYYVLRNPDHQMVNRRGDALHHGVLSYAYPEARQYKIGTIDWLLTNYDWDGVFVCTRSQSRPAEYADQFGFNEPAIREFEERYGVDPSRSEFNLRDWRRLQGEYLTRLLREIKDYLRTKGLPLAVGIPRASYLGPPIGNVYLDWFRWISHGIVDYLVIDQVAAICPSTWTFLWPDSQGFGYVQNYLTGKGIPPMEEDLAQTWSPVIAPSNAGLYLARMWHPFDEEQHAGLSRNPAVDGLVFSSFHYDNPQVLSRGLWAM